MMCIPLYNSLCARLLDWAADDILDFFFSITCMHVFTLF